MKGKISERQFWEAWEGGVGAGFSLDSWGELRDACCRCPLVAVAHSLGLADIGRCDFLAVSAAQWARRVATAADTPYSGPTRRRLLAALPAEAQP